ncbi:MAG: chemotaxis response regulator protein-glutamate methylesterase [Acidobacteria bacterium]|nr:chemotaxis response regulator protein-glutamate methylesterase [Acidobacteriota bacterium]
MTLAPERRARPIRVLIVDDSAVVRRLLTDALTGQPDIEVVGTAPDPFVARDKILELSPDVLTLDIEMPRMNGLSFLKRVMHYQPMPVIIIGSLGVAGCAATVEALRLGAVEVLCKPHGPYSVGELAAQLAAKVRMAADSNVKRRVAVAGEGPVKEHVTMPVHRHLVAIGSSTGGTQAVEVVLNGFGADCPPILIAQHIPAGFSRAFAQRLNQVLAMEVREAVDGDVVKPGLVLIAPGNFHMLLQKRGGQYCVAVKEGPLVCYQRPSVDVLFSSVAQVAGADSVAAILTGMGSDGAQGMKRIHDAGGWTIAQDEASCVVYGMPREAVKAGGVDEIHALGRIASSIEQGLRRPQRKPQGVGVPYQNASNH